MFLPRNLAQLGFTPLSDTLGVLAFLAFGSDKGGLIFDFQFELGDFRG
jgi:hypothetical protein